MSCASGEVERNGSVIRSPFDDVIAQLPNIVPNNSINLGSLTSSYLQKYVLYDHVMSRLSGRVHSSHPVLLAGSFRRHTDLLQQELETVQAALLRGEVSDRRPVRVPGLAPAVVAIGGGEEGAQHLEVSFGGGQVCRRHISGLHQLREGAMNTHRYNQASQLSSCVPRFRTLFVILISHISRLVKLQGEIACLATRTGARNALYSITIQLTTGWWPLSAARCSAVRRWLSGVSRAAARASAEGAAWRTSSCSSDACPRAAATWSGVSPALARSATDRPVRWQR